MFVKFLQIPTLFMFVFFVSACGSEGPSGVVGAEDYSFADDIVAALTPKVPDSTEKKVEGLTKAQQDAQKAVTKAKAELKDASDAHDIAVKSNAKCYAYASGSNDFNNCLEKYTKQSVTDAYDYMTKKESELTLRKEEYNALF